MLSPDSPTPHPIDIVITWVDGDDPAHKAKRLRHLLPAGGELHENGINPHRWACSDELSYCLRSIGHHAPWVGTIFIITDAQRPDISNLPNAIKNKIKIIDHRAIFAGYEHVLPTFNSLAIESMLWRIEGLAEHFVYFNDDVFLTAPLQTKDVFVGGDPVLRGKWVDHSNLGKEPRQLVDPALFHDFMQLNAARMLDHDAGKIFATAHVAFPMRRSVMAQLFSRFHDAFVANIAPRFRDITQFQPQSLHTHACILANACVISTAADHLHLRTGALEDYALEEVQAYLQKALQSEVKFLCINDLTQVETAIPDVRDWIETAIAPKKVAA